MLIVLLLVGALLLLGIAAQLWGVDSTRDVDPREWWNERDSCTV